MHTVGNDDEDEVTSTPSVPPERPKKTRQPPARLNDSIVDVTGSFKGVSMCVVSHPDDIATKTIDIIKYKDDPKGVIPPDAETPSVQATFGRDPK